MSEQLKEELQTSEATETMADYEDPVSYTHLTLPTKLEV